MSARRRIWIGPLALAAAGLGASGARAEPTHIFRLPGEPVEAAVLRFGVQGAVSVGGLPAAGCTGRSRAVVGVMTPSEALRRLLPDGCAFERIDARAFRVFPARAAPQPAPAPAPRATAPATDVSEIIVTAEKRREPERGAPFAVTALNPQEIRRAGATSFADVALKFPGVAETNLGPGRNKIFIRGISDGAFTGRTQSTVGLYLGEIPITYNAPDPDLRLADVERVEVLRGPQGTLYGSGSIGGIVRVVAAPPDPHAFAAAAQVEGRLNAHGEASQGGEAMLNLPLAGGRAAVRGVAYVDAYAGYLDNPVLGLEDTNRGTRKGVRLAARADVGGGWRVEGNAVQQSIKTDDAQYTQGGGRYQRTTRLREPHDSDFTLLGASLDHPGSTTDFRISAGFIDHDIASRYDATGAFGLPMTSVAAFDESQRVELWVGEVTAGSAGASRVRWLVGAFGSHALETSGGRLDATPSGGAVRSVFDRRDRLDEAAAFGELTFELVPRLTAAVGGRVFLTHVETRSGAFGLAPGLAERRAARTDRGVSPKLRLSYAFSADSVLYVQAQDGFRAGGFNVPAGADGMAGEPDLVGYRPDRLRSYEMGGEALLFDRKLRLRAAAFRAVWKNVQTDQFRPSGLPVTLNIGDGSNLGLEAEAVWRPDAHWRVRLAGLIDDPELTRSSNLFPARVDVGLPGVASRTGSAEVTYRWDVAADVQAEISVEAATVGRSFLTFDGRPATKMGEYTQGRISAALFAGPWEAHAFVDNVAGDSGDTFAFGNPFSLDRARQQTPLPPRSFGLAIRRTF